ncbi:MAG: hypothetical protein Kow0090_06090 [Myxococcota bacterium]
MAVDKNKIMVNALKFVQKGDYERALKELAPALKDYPKDANLLSKQGEWLVKLGKRKEASDVFQKVAEIFIGQGFLKKALAVYRQMTQLLPDEVSIHEKLADLYQQLNYISEAKAEYETIAIYYEKKGEIQKALDTLQSMVELEPDNLVSRIKLADHYAREQIFSKASIELEKVAATLKEQNRSQEYLKVAERLFKYQPENKELALEIAQIYHAQGDLQNALNTLHLLYKDNPKHIPTLELLAQVFFDMQQKKKSLAIWLELARIYQENNDEENKKRSLKHIIEIDPNNEFARKELGMPPPSSAKPPLPQAQPPKPSPKASSEKPKITIAKPPTEPPPPKTPEKPKPEKKKTAPHIDKMLTEINVYLKYGLLDQAFEHIAKILKEEPENIDAHKLRVKIARDNNRKEVLILALAELGRVLLMLKLDDELKQTMKELEALAPNDKRLAILKEGKTEFPELTEEEVILIETGEFKAIVEEEEVKPAKPKIKPKSEPGEGEALIDSELQELAQGIAEDKPLSAKSSDLNELDLDEPPELTAEEAGISESDITAEEVDDILGIEPKEEGVEDSVILDENEEEKFADEYEEAEFFVEQGLIDEAKEIYKNILEKYPEHRETKRRLTALESGEIEEDIKVGEDRLSTDESLLFDLGDEVEDAIEEIEEKKGKKKEVGSVFEKVRAASSPQFEEAENHINLGIAYREMGLFKEAEDELVQAVAHESFAIQAYELIGRCRMDQGDYNGAISQFKKALTVREMEPTEAVAIFYELGEAYFHTGDLKEANYYFKKVSEVQADFREVQARLKETKGEEAEIDTSGWSDDDFLSDAEAALDANFDDLFDEDEKKKDKKK